MIFGVSWGITTRRFENGAKLYSAKLDENGFNVTFKTLQDAIDYALSHARKDAEFEFWYLDESEDHTIKHKEIHVECNDFIDANGIFDKNEFKSRVESLIGKDKEGQ